MFYSNVRPTTRCRAIYGVERIEPVSVIDPFRDTEAVACDVERCASTLFGNHA